MKRFLLAAVLLAGCTPQAPSTPPPPDPLGVGYVVRVGQALLPNVRSVSISGQDIELLEFRQGSAPNVVTLAPGRVGFVKLVIRTDWTAAEQTIETWRLAIASGSGTPTQTHRTITLEMAPLGGTTATYTFQRCLPSEHQMQLGDQHSRVEQVFRVTCESVVRS